MAHADLQRPYVGISSSLQAHGYLVGRASNHGLSLQLQNDPFF